MKNDISMSVGGNEQGLDPCRMGVLFVKSKYELDLFKVILYMMLLTPHYM